MSKWNPFPYDDSDFRFGVDSLQASWDELHRGDCEPFPGDAALQQAWIAFHAGDFGEAVKLADAIGVAGHAVANKATGIYANYLEEDESRQVKLFQAAIARADEAIEALPEDPNAHYFRAFNLGRYSQTISVVKAIKQGFAGKIRESLEQVMELQPDHAEAHTAMGKLMGSVTYGASESEALEHLETAIELTPDSPIAHIEYANGLYLLYGDKRLDEVTEAYVKASEMEPRDAMECLDIEFARSELE